MNKKSIVLGLMCMALALPLTGCGTSADMKELQNLEASEGESNVSAVSLSTVDKESLVYAQVTDRQLLDLTTLAACDETYIPNIEQFMNTVNDQLIGAISTDDGVIDENIINYMLFEMEKTPFYWSRTGMVIRGMDTSSRNVVVDVTYSTTGATKPVKPDSTIVRGEPNYNQLLQVRLERWAGILSAKYDSTGNLRSSYTDLVAEDQRKFEEVYGKVDDIIKEQNQESLASTVYENGIENTYNCLVDDPSEAVGGTMTFRFILEPSYAMGLNLGWSCSHVYLTSYTLASDPTAGLQVTSDEGTDIVIDNIDKLMNSYYKCIDESNHSGLYTLVADYKKYDKYFEDYFNNTYRNNNNYTISLFNVEGKTVTYGVTLSRKVRAKNSKMSLPIYTERYLYTATLVGDKLQILNETLLSSVLEGEPAITTKDADVNGFSSSVTLTNDDKRAIEERLSEFGVVQLKGEYNSDKFSKSVDISLPTGVLTTIRENMESGKGVKKVVWLTNYLQGSSNYASVTCKELTQRKDESILERDVTYDLLFKNGSWYVSNYVINSSVRLDTTELTTKNCLFICNKDEVTDFTSQVKTGQNSEVDEVPDASEGVQSASGVERTYTFEPTEPIKKETPEEKKAREEKEAKEAAEKEGESGEQPAKAETEGAQTE